MVQRTPVNDFSCLEHNGNYNIDGVGGAEMLFRPIKSAGFNENFTEYVCINLLLPGRKCSLCQYFPAGRRPGIHLLSVEKA
jgi:hypothetical protein